MQTFLPVADFRESARILDWRRCWKQVVEAKQILDVLGGKPSRWKNHPAVLMWGGCDSALTMYYNIFWTYCVEVHEIKVEKTHLLTQPDNLVMPPWFGDYDFHASHRSNLLRKNFEFYSQYGWQERDDLPYVWPVRKHEVET